MNYIEIENQKRLAEILNNETNITKYAFQNLDFNTFEKELNNKTFSDCLFMGCELPDSLICVL